MLETSLPLGHLIPAFYPSKVILVCGSWKFTSGTKHHKARKRFVQNAATVAVPI